MLQHNHHYNSFPEVLHHPQETLFTQTITSHSPLSVFHHSFLSAHIYCCGLLQTGTWEPESIEKREKERESSISRATWKTNKAHAQDLNCSRRHRASSQGGLQSPGEKVSSVGFHVQKRMKTERTPSLQWNKGILLAELYAYLFSVK